MFSIKTHLIDCGSCKNYSGIKSIVFHEPSMIFVKFGRNNWCNYQHQIKCFCSFVVLFFVVGCSFVAYFGDPPTQENLLG